MSNPIKRLLMVDDDSSLCESMRDYLAQYSDTYKFIGGVCTYSSAIELFKDGMPHIVILDMMLGAGLDGSDLVDEFREIANKQSFNTDIFVVSKSGMYEKYCIENRLMFRQKGEDDNPEMLIKWIERFIGSVTSSTQTLKFDITPPKDRRERMKDYLFAAFSNAGAHKYNAYEDCLYIIPRMVELAEVGERAYTLAKVYEERGCQCKSTKDAVEARMRNMLKTVWKNNSDELNKQFYPSALGKHHGEDRNDGPTPDSFISYYVKLLTQLYPNNIEKI